MKNKGYLIQYSSNDKWQINSGVCIIVEENRRNAIRKFTEKIKDRKIKSISLIKYKKGLIFNQDVSIL